MVNRDIWIQGMHCDACEKTIAKSLQRIGVQVDDIRYTNERVAIQYDPQQTAFSDIARAVTDVGYTAREQLANVPVGHQYQRLQRIAHSFISNPNAYVLEKQIIKASVASLFIVSLLTYLTYFLFFWNTPGFGSRYGQYLPYLVISVVALGAAIRHQRAYRSAVACMTGMMIGMTIGMLSGFLVGIVLGATNGMFTGAIFAVVVGMGVGAWVGACCGIMGVMEGMMAGLMGGTMGPMISVMMFTDHLAIFFPIFTIACLMILAGLSYLVYKEHKGVPTQIQMYSFWPFTLLNFVVVLAAMFVMVWGPKAPFLAA